LGDLPDRLTLQRGEDKIVRLPSAAGAGYRWEATVDDESVVGAHVAFDSALTTAGGGAAFSPDELLTLRGRAIGATRVRCVQRRGWEREAQPLAEHTLLVNVESTDTKGSHGG
jgi:predicted secreted protein